MVFSSSVSAELKAGLSFGTVGIDHKSIAGPATIARATLFVGPVPVYIGLDINLGVSAHAAIPGASSVSASARVGFTASGGVSYDNGNFSPFSSTTDSSGVTPPSFSFKGSADISLEPRLDLKLYGIAGPYLAGYGGAVGSFDPASKPWWSVDGKLGATAGLKAEIKKGPFNFSANSPDFDLFSKTFRIADSGTGDTPVVPPQGEDSDNDPPDLGGEDTGVESIATGLQHSCSITLSGEAKCWGKNDEGQLGNGTNVDSNTPVAVPGLSGVTAIAAGDNHTCALNGHGVVKCWGEHAYGQLGIGWNPSSTTPVEVIGANGATAIAANSRHTCALVSGGEVKCWGNYDYGLIGGVHQVSSTPFSVPGASGAVAIAAGRSHGCLETGAGAVKCWGDNSLGQLGDGTNVSASIPVTVSGLSGVVEISAGGNSSCAVRSDGGLSCWGYNNSGQLGNGTTTTTNAPVSVTGFTNAAYVSSGGFHSCAVDADGIQSCWGRNESGQLGDGTNLNASAPVGVIP